MVKPIKILKWGSESSNMFYMEHDMLLNYIKNKSEVRASPKNYLEKQLIKINDDNELLLVYYREDITEKGYIPYNITYHGYIAVNDDLYNILEKYKKLYKLF